jgi:AraC-like DNA-binding protein
MLREHFVALDVVDPIPDGPFVSQVRSTLLGNLSAAAVSSPPQSCVRTGGLARDGDAYLQVGILARGRAVVEQDGRQAALEPGRFVVYETDRPFAWHFLDRWQLLVLTWPRHLVDLDAGESRAATARTLGGDRLGGIIGRTLAETVLRPPEFVDDGRRLAGELAALVGMVLGAHGDDEPLSASGAADLRRRVASYVADHLDDPDLGVESIARAHFVSVRGLHRAFAGADLTVGSLIRRLRLAHARLRLSSPRDAHLSVTDIAHACGFVDLPTFSHGFKQEYHESPSTYRRRSAPPLH